MSISIKLTGVKCEADCAYCYQDALRKTGKDWDLDLDKLLAQIEKEWRATYYGGIPFLHGGEALDEEIEVLDKVLAKVYSLAERTSVQTYCRTITDEHIAMFKKYKTSVGVSIDGPWPLNELRKMPGEDGEELTNRIMKNIKRLKEAGIPVSVICVLHKKNAVGDRLDTLMEWLRDLKSIGVTGGRLNPMISAYHGKEHEMSPAEAAHAWRRLTRFVLTEMMDTDWKPMRDAIDSLLGYRQGTCIFGQCMFYRANAEPVVLPTGETANCLKSGASNGNVYPRLEQKSFSPEFGQIRYKVLPQVEQVDNGCKGCEYWVNCQGGCPPAGVDNDWRNKTRFCPAYKALFSEADKLLKNIVPALITTVDIVKRGNPDLSNGVAGLNFDPFEYTSKRSRGHCQPPRQKAQQGQQRKGQPRPQEQEGEYEHIDGGVRHVDSDMPVSEQKKSKGQKSSMDGWLSKEEHIDGDIRHLDSDIGGN